MVDSGIKKVVVKNKELPLVSFDDTDLFYDLRYRIISEDKNRTSHWSPVRRIVVPPTTDAGLPYTTDSRIHIYTVGSNPTIINCSWSYKALADNPSDLEKVFSDVSIFDVWIRYNPNLNNDATWEEWQYVTMVSSTFFSTIKRTALPDPKQIEIAIQIPTTVKQRDDRLTLFLARHNI